MAEFFWALVAIGGPILIASCFVLGLLTHRSPLPRALSTPPDRKTQ